MLEAPLNIENLKCHGHDLEQFSYPLWWGHEEHRNPYAKSVVKKAEHIPIPIPVQRPRPAAGLPPPPSPVQIVYKEPCIHSTNI